MRTERRTQRRRSDIGDAGADDRRQARRSEVVKPEIIVANWRSARKEIDGLAGADVRGAFHSFEPRWDEVFPVEQARIVLLLVERAGSGRMMSTSASASKGRSIWSATFGAHRMRSA